MGSPRILSVLIAFCLATLSYVFMFFFPEIPSASRVIISVAMFISSTVLYYLAIDTYVGKEINEILERLQNISIEIKGVKKIKNDHNPLQKLNQQIDQYVLSKENEIAILKQQEAYRKELIANISHELKTPLFTAQGFVNTLIDGAVADPNVAEDFLKKAAKSLDNLDKLVSDILIMSKAEWDELRLDFKKHNLKSILKEAVEEVHLLALEKKSKIIKKIEIKGPLYVIVDEQSIRLVFKNLLENALKYSADESTIIVKITADGKYLNISIEDQGLGISIQDQERIFERFYRAEKSRARSTGGTGLGLAIVKHLLVLQNSQIRLKSTLGEGSVFSFKLERV